MSANSKVEVSALIAEVLRLEEAAPLPLVRDQYSPECYLVDSKGETAVRILDRPLMAYVECAVNAAPILARTLQESEAAAGDLRQRLRASEDSRVVMDALLTRIRDALGANEGESPVVRVTALRSELVAMRAKLTVLAAILDEQATPDSDLPRGRLGPALRLVRSLLGKEDRHE